MNVNGVEMIEELYYKSFKKWFKDYPDLKHPDIAITQGLVRNIARLVYDKLKEKT